MTALGQILQGGPPLRCRKLSFSDPNERLAGSVV